MITDLAARFRPVAPPQIIENAYTDDQHRRLLNVVCENGPWQLILAENTMSLSTLLTARPFYLGASLRLGQTLRSMLQENESVESGVGGAWRQP